MTDEQIEAEVLTSLAHRDEQSSACPSEIARSLSPGDGDAWRELMPRIRAVTARLAHAGRVVITRGRVIVSTDHLEGGPIRIRRGANFLGRQPPD